MPHPPHNLPDLPEPNAEERARHEALVACMRQEMRAAGGQLSFERYMELALYAPGLGYYSSARAKLGHGGDFVTAPELSPLFGRCLARAVAEVLDRLGGGEILEAGAGSGKLAADLLNGLAELGQRPARYRILELSGSLRAEQLQTLRDRAGEHLPRIEWLDRLPEPGFRGVVLGNELLDALPVARFVVRADGVYESDVAPAEDGFAWRERPARASVIERTALFGLTAGYTSEIGFAAEAWVRSVGERLADGLLLLIDYGFPRAEYYHPQRLGGTLMCHYRHRTHPDPLILAGLQDISAHVDFTAIAEAGRGAGLQVAGYTSQAAFLLGSGLAEIASGSDPADTRAHLALTQQVKKLTLPSEMGELFKVIGLARGLDGFVLPGFALQDRRGRL